MFQVRHGYERVKEWDGYMAGRSEAHVFKGEGQKRVVVHTHTNQPFHCALHLLNASYITSHYHQELKNVDSKTVPPVSF